MRRYSTDVEERVRLLGLVRDWTQSGMLDPAQGEALGASLRVELRRTNPFLRAGLALFTALIITAFVGLVLTFLDLREKVSIVAVTGVAALACIGIAEFLVTTYSCYRFGVEEVFAVAAVVLLAISGHELVSVQPQTLRWLPNVVGLLIGSVGAFGLYRRFGFIYAALGSVVCAAAIPFQLNLPPELQRVLAAAVIGSVFVIARVKRRHYGDDYPGDEYAVLQAGAIAGVYAVLNVQLSAGMGQGHGHGLFYWCSYGITWILPLVCLRLGIRDRDRALMDVSLALAIVTLTTSKEYLGWARNTWDPMVLGIGAIGVAVAVRRWIERGPGGERNGFTLDPDRDAQSLLSVASALVPPGLGSGDAPSRPDPPEFGGGRSGGAGGGAGF
jgi:hypothetical protein